MKKWKSLEEKYESRAPGLQNALDLLPEWTASFPEEYDLTAGSMALYNDPRIHWAIEQSGSLAGKTVLELGPLEGSHSYMLERAGAAEIVAIEANKAAYLKCLITKEVYQLQRTRFLLGDFVKYLEQTDRHFDVILASGVLYHMREPGKLLQLMSQKCDELILWTHYFDNVAMPEGDVRRKPFETNFETVTLDGYDMTLHRRSYLQTWTSNKFCGGPVDQHYWMEKDQIIEFCGRAGFADVRESFDEKDHPGGPSCLIYFRKPPLQDSTAAQEATGATC